MVSFFLYSFTIKSSRHICKGISGNQIIVKWTQENIPFTTMNMQNDWSVAQSSPLFFFFLLIIIIILFLGWQTNTEHESNYFFSKDRSYHCPDDQQV